MAFLKKTRPPIYGLMAEFDSPEGMLEGAKRTYAAGYRRMNAYSPFPIEGMAEAIGFHEHKLPWIVFGGGLIGCLSGFGMQYYASVMAYPLNIGGKPLNSWPSFVPVTFEMTILVAVFSAVLGMLALNGLPHPYHPVFNVPRFALASRNRFFFAIEANDPKFDAVETRKLLEEISGHEVFEIEH
jgi:ActD protein